MVQPTPPQPQPQVIASYRLGRVLGSGGMGVVYEATDLRDGSTVALKLLHVHLEADETFRERFIREAHVAAVLRSPYTVHLLDYGVEEGHFFLVMKFVDGDSLRDVLRLGPMEPARSLRIAAQVARALEEAEARGVVHRDIKPDNVMLAEGEMAQVMDFGIARQAGSFTLTGTGAFVGTLTYAAPEAAGGTVDHRSDIYSLGVTLYHMLTGRPAVRGRDAGDHAAARRGADAAGAAVGAPGSGGRSRCALPGEGPRRPLPVGLRAGGRAGASGGRGRRGGRRHSRCRRRRCWIRAARPRVPSPCRSPPRWIWARRACGGGSCPA